MYDVLESRSLIQGLIEGISLCHLGLCGSPPRTGFSFLLTLHGPCCVVVAAATAHWHLRLALASRGQHLEDNS